jgi:hypothetical protein
VLSSNIPITVLFNLLLARLPSSSLIFGNDRCTVFCKNIKFMRMLKKVHILIQDLDVVVHHECNINVKEFSCL